MIVRFLSVCSGIEAASVAWRPLGWKAWAFAEIDGFASAVLAHHYPDTPNLGDMNGFKEWPDAALDVLCGGTPCQSFSNAGLRAGLDDPRGELMLTFGAVAARYRPRWLVWENVPGVLSSNGGRDFGAFLGLLGFLGYGFAYRVLDAQYVRVDGHGRAVPQRRNRVFVIGCLGDWRGAAAVLLERESLRGDLAPRRSAGPGIAAGALRSTDGGSDVDHAQGGHLFANDIAGSLMASHGPRGHGFAGFEMNQSVDAGHLIAFGGNNTAGPIDVETACRAKGGTGHGDFESETFIAHTLRGDGFDASEDGTGRGTPLVPICFDPTQITSGENRSNPQPGDPCHTLSKGMHAPAIAFDTFNQAVTGEITQTLCSRGETPGGNAHLVPAIAFDARQSDVIQYGDKAGPLDTDGHTMAVAFQERGREAGRTLEIGGDVAYACTAPSGGGRAQERNVLTPTMRVRRLTPTECERLMGFPDGYTAIPWRGKPAADGPRYKALGNSWATNCARWVGRRIALVDSIQKGIP